VAYCDSPGPLDKGLDTYYAISPIPDDWTDAQVDSFLREYNNYMIHVLTIHEAMPGHYLEGAHSANHPSTLRAVFRSGPFAEGWAVYTERTLADAGYLDNDPLFRLMQLKFYARAVANVELEEALKNIELALQLVPPNAAFLDTRGFVHYQLGNDQQALEDLEEAVRRVESKWEQSVSVWGTLEQAERSSPERARQLHQLAEGVAVIRVMPNTPALVDEGMSAISPGAHCDDDHLRQAEDLVGTAVFLASDASAFLTGQVIYVDGGITAGLHWPIDLP
jgi:tetratricopeptide (TPR) repeat protein